ncbi:hypothetical protein SYNPS1DRAFT_31387 [Syncephalis pseudoplumigaleata]|uniref:VPS9 domain-containing protein n=1 Tax=Syncephalis pseudoplumigaleata TaxID=1712513 RepID=A0A4P9YU57_9FUNG|nr:hypothetical protein SYNPS1DRAFT_31387 [Syncephalis pseudoplumigaleata]|eukprot:RKP22932.1 hypothetical protein SYNPS1DRAFT_31387 [Syncephalis pseudoplumigaleata]
MSSIQTADPATINHPLSSEALAEVERRKEEEELRSTFGPPTTDDTALTTATATTATAATAATVVAASSAEATRRTAPTLVKSSWLPVRSFSFFASEEDAVTGSVGQNTVGHALWSRLYQQQKEDVDLLAFLQARKMVTGNKDATADQMAVEEHQYKLTSLSGWTVVIDKQQHALWTVPASIDDHTASIEKGEVDKAENLAAQVPSRDTIDIVTEQLEMMLHKQPIIGVVIARPLAVPTPADTVRTLNHSVQGDVDAATSRPLPSPGFMRLTEWEDVVKYLDSFVLEFGRTCRQVDPAQSVDTCSEEYQQFIEQVQSMIESTEHLAKDLDIEQALEWMEGYLTIELYPCIFRPAEDVLADQLLATRCMSLRLLHVGLEHLGVSVSEASMPALASMVEEACRELKVMDRRHPPLDKLEAIIQLHEIIVQTLHSGKLSLSLHPATGTELNGKTAKEPSDQPAASSSTSASTAGSSNADQLFPLLVYIIIEAAPSHLVSNIR